MKLTTEQLIRDAQKCDRLVAEVGSLQALGHVNHEQDWMEALKALDRLAEHYWAQIGRTSILQSKGGDHSPPR